MVITLSHVGVFTIGPKLQKVFRSDKYVFAAFFTTAVTCCIVISLSWISIDGVCRIVS